MVDFVVLCPESFKHSPNQAAKGLTTNSAKANTKTDGSEMASLDLSTQEGVLNVTNLVKPIVLTIKKNSDVPMVKLEEMDPNSYGKHW